MLGQRSLALAFVCCMTPLLAPAAPVDAVQCKLPEKVVASRADAKVREAAHRGFTYLARASTQWTQQHGCFGCHVQAVTLEALTAAKHHQYDVDPKDLDAMVKALQRGVTAGGRTTGVAFEGAAWARYDRWIDNRQTEQLLRYAAELMTLQDKNGSIRDDDARLPITGGTMQTTYQAAQTWRQAYARTANDKWLTPLRQAERYLTRTSDGWEPGANVYIQDINFALLGLAAAGVTRTEPASARLQKLLLARQNQDGGWGLEGRSDAFATGQTVYALKVAGLSDDDTAVARGLSFLLKAQDKDGAWRTARSGQNGAEKGETMWAVLGLVTVDVASISVAGLLDGQHVLDSMPITATASDNQSGGIAELAFFVDDLRVQTACGPKLSLAWDTTRLSPGKHLIDLVAINAQGKQSRRRFEVFAGDVFMTEVGATFDEAAQKTRVSLRNIAGAQAPGTVELEIWTLHEKDEQPKAKVFSTSRAGTPGAMELEWEGLGNDGRRAPRGRYVAKLVFKDSAGKARQSESTLFLHDTDAVQRATLGEVEGALQLGKLGIGSANTTVELVDRDGRVVQSVRSTEQGNYRFKNIKPGDYRVRARKDGYQAQESSVSTAAGAPAAKADMTW